MQRLKNLYLCTTIHLLFLVSLGKYLLCELYFGVSLPPELLYTLKFSYALCKVKSRARLVFYVRDCPHFSSVSVVRDR